MSIYPSSKVLPYVYQCIHKITGKIYIGSRTNKSQKLPSDRDFPQYKTSSKIVKPIFDEFDWFIVAEFFNGNDAYTFEQQMIYEQWQVSKELSLNRVCYHEKKSFNNTGIKFSDSHKQNMRKPKLNTINMRKPKSESHSKNIGDSLRGRSLSESHKQNLRKPCSEEHKYKLRKPKSYQTKRNMSNIIDVIAPDGFVIENITMKELCSQFNLVYSSIVRYFSENRSYRGFFKL